MFGDQGGKFSNGYDKMTLKDTNEDGKLSADELNDLALWVGDGDATLWDGTPLQVLVEHRQKILC